jgi:transposase
MLGDLQGRQVREVCLGRKQEEVVRVLTRPANPENVKAVSRERSASFAPAVRNRVPHAPMVGDPFPVLPQGGLLLGAPERRAHPRAPHTLARPESKGRHHRRAAQEAHTHCIPSPGSGGSLDTHRSVTDRGRRSHRGDGGGTPECLDHTGSGNRV